MIPPELLEELGLILKKALRIVDDIAEKQKADNNEVITPEEYTALMWELEGWPDIVKAMLKNYNINSVQQLPRKELMIARNRIKEIKNTHDSYGVK